MNHGKVSKEIAAGLVALKKRIAAAKIPSSKIPKALLGVAFGSNLEKDKRYDQILHHPIYPDNFTNAGGVVDFHIDDAHIKELFPAGLAKEKFTFQLSDHLPLWLQIKTDIEGFKLDEIIQS